MATKTLVEKASTWGSLASLRRDLTAQTVLSQDLTGDEKSAAVTYGVNATYFHAVAQGWLTALEGAPQFDAFYKTCGTQTQALDRAIAKSTLTMPTALFSGHGIGYGPRGALTGNPSGFVGLSFQYAGYISCSVERQVAIDFMRKRAVVGTNPTLLALHLPKGFHALDMNLAGITGEFEVLVGRDARFRVTNANPLGVDSETSICLDLTPWQ